MDARRRRGRAFAIVAASLLLCAAPPALAQTPVTVSGTVTDGSGHGWPLAAQIDVGGQTLRTDPLTGHFTVELTTGTTHDFTVSADGHETMQRTVTLASNNPDQDFALLVDPTCAGLGYAVDAAPALIDQPFDATTTPAGWTVTAGTPSGTWRFDDPGFRGNLTGGSGSFAILDSDFFGIGNSQDGSLITPNLDLTEATRPELSFNSDYRSLNTSIANLDVSTDGGSAWTTLREWAANSARGPRVETFPLTAAGGHPSVRVRFRYRGTWAWWWQVDNVKVVDPCTRVAGGIVGGTVTDRASGTPIAGAVVTGPKGATATTAADGRYRMFVAQTGSRSFTASAGGFVTAARDADVIPDAAVRRDFELDPAPVAAQQATEPGATAWRVAGAAVLATRTDGSVRTLLNAPAPIDALAAVGDDLVLSFSRPVRVPGVARRVDDSDLVRFAGGAFALWLDGSDVGLTKPGEDVDAVEVLPDGRLLVSTEGAARRGALRAQDEDVLAFTPRNLGARTAGRWRLYLDGGDIGLRSASEDVDGLAVDATGAIGLSVRGRLGVPGLHAGAGDVATFVPSRLGRRTAGRFAPGLMLTGTAGDFDVP